MPDRRRRNPQERGGGGGGGGAADRSGDGNGADAEGPPSRLYADPDAVPVPASAPAPEPDATPDGPSDPPSDLPSDTASGTPSDLAPDESDAARRRRRAQFLRELNEAKALRERVKPRQARAARMRQQMRMRTFRW